MFFKNSFNLTNDENKSKSREKLYQPKKFRWCKFIVIPLLIAFILLLILTNIDFTGNAYDKTWMVENNNKLIVSVKIADSGKTRQIKSMRGLTCFSGDNKCTLTCQGGNTNNIYKQLEPLYPVCGNELDLYLYECTFPAGSMKSSFLQGNFRLRTLAIIDCNLANIEAQAFQQISVTQLQALHLINTQLVALSETTFMGLTALETLNITNKVAWTSLKAESFLKPLANTLKTLRIEEETVDNQTYDPYEWLKGVNMTNLQEIDFRDNRFPETLTDLTFVNTKRVQKLNLANCSLNYLSPNVFDGIVKTLKYLDVSWNRFTTLDPRMLVKLKELNSLNLANNNWDCTCFNQEMLNIIQENKVTIEDGQNTKCATPFELGGEIIFNVELECEDETTTLSTTTEVTSATETTNGTSQTTMPGTKTTEKLTTLTTAIGSESTWTATNSIESLSTDITNEETSEFTEFPTTIPDDSTASELTEFPTTIPDDSTTATPTTTNTTSTTKTTTTTLRPNTTTTTTESVQPPTPSKPLLDIKCTDTITNKPAHISLTKAQIQFTFAAQSTTSVRIIIYQQLINFSVLYFTNYTSASKWSQGSSTKSGSNSALLVSDLTPGTVYVFCLIPNGIDEVSPFDCKSYYVPIPQPQGWIMDDDQKWIIALVVLGVCLCLLLGVIVTFAVARLKNRRKVKRQRLRSQVNCPRGQRLSGASYFNERVSEVPLTDQQNYVQVMPQRTNRHHNYDINYYEEMDM